MRWAVRRCSPYPATAAGPLPPNGSPTDAVASAKRAAAVAGVSVGGETLCSRHAGSALEPGPQSGAAWRSRRSSGVEMTDDTATGPRRSWLRSDRAGPAAGRTATCTPLRAVGGGCTGQIRSMSSSMPMRSLRRATRTASAEPAVGRQLDTPGAAAGRDRHVAEDADSPVGVPSAGGGHPRHAAGTPGASSVRNRTGTVVGRIGVPVRDAPVRARRCRAPRPELEAGQVAGGPPVLEQLVERAEARRVGAEEAAAARGRPSLL